MKFYEYKWVIVLIVVSILFYLLGQFVLNQFWAFAGALLAGSLALAIFQFSDDKIIGSVNTYQEIVVNKNIALGLYYVALALVIAIPFGSAFLVFLAI